MSRYINLSNRASLIVVLVFCTAINLAHAEPPQTRYWEGAHLAAIRQAPQEQSATVRDSLKQLVSRADWALRRGPYSVVDKDIVPPSGDKHDYLSFSRYWWPNPDTDDGLPYVRHDGRVNRALLSQGDRNRIGDFYDDVESLALASYLLDSDKYAPHAVRLLRTWFLDPQTRMNPNINFGQAVPGRADGRGVGIIDTRHFIRVLDSVALLDAVGALPADDQSALKKWFGEYLNWLLTSELGIEERSADNNHGSWYAAQTARVALFVDRPNVAREVISIIVDRIPDGFNKQGGQPEELQRTRSLHYSLFNLSALATVARLGEHVGLDVWDRRSESGASLARGFEFAAPYVCKPTEWKYPEMGDFGVSDRQAQLFLLASTRWKNPEYAALLEQARTRYDDQHFSPLMFAVGTKATVGAANGPREYTVTETANFTPEPLDVELPDLSPFTADSVRNRIPAERNGKVSLGKAGDFPLLDEAFRRKRGEDLQRRQGTDNPRVILIQRGAVTLDQAVEQLNDSQLADRQSGVVTVRLPVVIQPGAALIIDGRATPTVRLSTDRGAFIANAGRLYIVDSTVVAWNEAASQPSAFESKEKFRPFITSYVRSETHVASSKFQNLGFSAPSAYGFSLTSHPERGDNVQGGVEPSDDWPTGVIVDCEFRGLYYGFYSFEARDVAIVDNRYVQCIVYGIDPHDRSTRLTIARNETTGIIEKHGIIGSRGVSDSFIFDNASHENAGAGIMLDRQCTNNVVHGNRVFNNGQGVAIYESPSNTIVDNTIAFNTKSGVRVRNSSDVEVRNNTIVGHGDYALEISAKRLDDHDKRAARGDLYDQRVSASFYDNRIGGNKGLAKGTNIQRLRLSNVRRVDDLQEIAEKLKVRDYKTPEFKTSDGDRKVEFGQELKPLAVQLRRAVDDADLMVQATESHD